MSILKNMSRGGYIVIGIVATLILVPTGIAAATVAYNGIEGTNGTTATVNLARVSSGGELLTTSALPTSYRNFWTLFSSGGCVAVTPPSPSGQALDIQDLAVTIASSNPQLSSGVNTEGGEAEFIVAKTSANYCVSGTGGSLFADDVPQGGNTGTSDLPQRPGYMVPNGYQVYVFAVDVGGGVAVSGSLVTSAGAPILPG